MTGLFLSDVNECETDNGGCSDSCVNREGSFECKCKDGYKVGDDKKTCEGKIYCQNEQLDTPTWTQAT